MNLFGSLKKPANDASQEFKSQFECDGFAILPGFFSTDFCDQILREVDLYTSPQRPPNSRITIDILHGDHSRRRVFVRDAPQEVFAAPFKINHLFTESAVVADAVFDSKLRAILRDLLDADPVTINSLNFRYGSQQPAHIDTWYMPPPKANSMVVASLCLEDVREDAGPLFYYPGSHRIPPYVFSHGGIHAVDDEMPQCRRYLDEQIASRGLKQQTFLGKKGDVFLWHAQLLHGGTAIADPARSRASLVVHYWGLDAMRGAPVATAPAGGMYFDRDYWETDGKPIAATPPVAPQPGCDPTVQSKSAAPVLRDAAEDARANSWADSLPPEFDARAYRARHKDLRKLDAQELEEHYRSMGKREQRNASTIATRKAFLGLIRPTARMLEIGPFTNPQCKGANVKYFDVLPTESLRERAKFHGLDPANCPKIDYVSESGDFQVIHERFDAALSCHVIEHQPDLIRHLQDVSRVLEPAGLYYLIVPDKRYCFDHFIGESSVAEIVAAHARSARVHDVLALIEHRAMTTHNDPARHWAGDHGEPQYKSTPQTLRDAADLFARSKGRYIDVHAWQFVPESLRESLEILFDVRVSPFRVLRVYPTVEGSNEFFAVLQKTSQEPVSLQSGLPSDFDAQLYLLANPDVAKAGANPVEHYLAFGRKEGRKLRPD
jgi:ectoine hydroxylase-related dioxygenase (phytanoyl-CoA dioxygenase family)/SAM-dependent methyltransferase